MKEIARPRNCIVVATDFSANASAAVRRAAHLAQQKKKELYLLHVVSPLEIYPELMVAFDTHLKDYERLKRANGLEALDQLASKIQEDFAIKISTKVCVGRAHTEIAKFAQDQSVDLVVVGFRGETNLIDTMIGSTALKLIMTTPCAVLIVKNTEITSYEQVVAAVDLTEKSSQVCSIACAVAPIAQIEVLHVFDVQQEVFSKCIDREKADIEKYYNSATKHIAAQLDSLIADIASNHLSSNAVDGYAPQVIYSRATEINADLVVLGKKSKSAMQEFLIGSVSRAVIDIVHCDVLLT